MTEDLQLLGELLSEVGAPFVVLQHNSPLVLAKGAYGSGTMKRLRGKKCRNTASFMTEIGAVLQFFYGFTEDWASLDDLIECLDEGRVGYTLVVEHAEELFADDIQGLVEFFSMIDRVGRVWSTAVRRGGRYDREALPLHFVLATSDVGFQERLESMGVAHHLWPQPEEVEPELWPEL